MRKRIAVLFKVSSILFGLCWAHSSSAAQNPRMIIMGDSLSSYQSSWPTRFRYLMEDQYNVQVMAQPGRSIRNFDPPRDLQTKYNEKVLYVLGGNDALGISNPRVTSYRMTQHMHQIISAGFEVLVIMPPVFHNSTSPIWTQEKRDSMVSTREAMRAVTKQMDIPVLDMTFCWDLDRLIDGVHPTPDLSEDMAWCIYDQIENIGNDMKNPPRVGQSDDLRELLHGSGWWRHR